MFDKDNPFHIVPTIFLIFLILVFGSIAVFQFVSGENNICPVVTHTYYTTTQFYNVTGNYYGYMSDINGNSGGSTSYNVGGGEQNSDDAFSGKHLRVITLYLTVINSQFNNSTFSYPSDYVGSLRVGVYNSTFDLVSTFVPTTYDISSLPWAHSSDGYTNINNAIAINFTGDYVLQSNDIIGWKFNGTLTNHAPDYIIAPLLVAPDFNDTVPESLAILHKSGIVGNYNTDLAGKFYEQHSTTTTGHECNGQPENNAFVLFITIGSVIVLTIILFIWRVAERS